MDDDDVIRFRAVVSKKPSAVLGLDVTYRSWSKTGVFVANVLEDGLVAAWNMKQEMPNRICAGDFISQVNDVSSDPVKMIEEMKVKTRVSIHVMRRKGAEPGVPPQTPPQEAAEQTESKRPRMSSEEVDALQQELHALDDEALAGLTCIALERRPWLTPQVLGADDDQAGAPAGPSSSSLNDPFRCQ
mmetsp:Transcript_23336/g.43891  ORF Transcript_23336/g.43891 Transcript_23336/m.43891 type:complete len:187 (-) Transcript_23336:173-733(-)